jgi:predicted lipopolysaccharide heptosyltransferase III
MRVLHEHNISKVLVIKLRYIGDVLLTTPVLKNLRVNFPDARLDIMVNAGTEEVLKHNKDINGVIFVERGSLIRQLAFIRELRQMKYDLVIDVTDSDRSAIISYLSGAPIRVGYNSENRWRGRCYTHVVQANRDKMHTVDYQLVALNLLDIPIKSSELVLLLGQEDEIFADKILTEYRLDNGRPMVLIHPGARWWFKSWPPEYFAKLADVIQNDLKCHVILAGGPSDQGVVTKIQNLMTTQAVSLVDKTTVLQLAALLKRCQLYIGNDNGIMHVATAVGTPVIAFFGLTNPLLWGPQGSGHTVFYKGIDCNPCFPNGCVRGDQSCMRMITTEEVYGVVREMLQSSVKCTG